MNIKESIRRILSEETQIPSVIRRRVSSDDIEEAFEFALEQNADSMNNPRSIIFKEKEHTTLRVFSKFVIDDMVTLIEQEYFNDDNRIYFSDNEEDTEKYHEQIRKPLLSHYGDRIKERYNEVKSDNINEKVKKSKFFHRRVDLEEVRELLPYYSKEVFYTTKTYEQFKYELTLKAVESIMLDNYNIGWEELPEQEEIDFVTEVSEMFEDIIKDTYDYYRNR
jgi:hypothetical protein